MEVAMSDGVIIDGFEVVQPHNRPRNGKTDIFISVYNGVMVFSPAMVAALGHPTHAVAMINRLERMLIISAAKKGEPNTYQLTKMNGRDSTALCSKQTVDILEPKLRRYIGSELPGNRILFEFQQDVGADHDGRNGTQ